MYKKVIMILLIFLLIVLGGCTQKTYYDYTLTIEPSDHGEVITEETKSSKYKIIKLFPIAEDGWKFKNWSGENENDVKYNDNDSTWEIILDENKRIKAEFELKEYSLNINTEGEGDVLEEIIATAEESDYEYGTTVKLTAEPDENWFFSHWEGDLIGDNNPEEILIDNEKNITAVFKEYPSISGFVTVDYNFTEVNSTYETQSIKKINKQQELDKSDNINEIIIGFNSSVTKKERKRIIDNVNGNLIKIIDPLNAAVIKVSDYEQVKMMQQQLKTDSKIRYLEPNNRVFATGTNIPNDPLYSSQWNYRLIDLPYTWYYETGDNNIRVAVLDTGITTNHPDLQSRIDFDNAYNFISNNEDVNDENGHGTHVAGILGAVTNNNEGIAGTTWGSEILPLKVLNGNGSGTYSDIVESVLYAAGILDEPYNPEPVDIINMSLGASFDSELLKEAIIKAREKGILVVASSGNNDNNELLYPASYPETIAVGAVDCTGKRADYSNYAPELDVVAPGGDSNCGILSTYLNYDYRNMNGTSMATPHVSGLISLLLAKGTPSGEIKNILQETSIHPGREVFSEKLGYGLINTNFALNNVNKIKIVLGNRNDDTIEKIIETTVPIKGGKYSFKQVPVGEYSVFAWIDITDDDIINSGDYIQNSNLINFESGRQYNQDLTIYTH